MTVDQTSAIIDENVLDSYRMLQDEGQPDVVTEFIDTFLEDLPGRLKAIEAAISGRQPPVVKSAAHALKGSAGTIGAQRLAALCGQLEQLGKAGTIEGAPDLWTAISAESATARAVLLQYRDPTVPLAG